MNKGGQRSKTPFAEKAFEKGYTMAALAKALGKSFRQTSRIAGNPTPVHWLALAGLPDLSDDLNIADWEFYDDSCDQRIDFQRDLEEKWEEALENRG